MSIIEIILVTSYVWVLAILLRTTSIRVLRTNNTIDYIQQEVSSFVCLMVFYNIILVLILTAKWEGRVQTTSRTQMIHMLIPMYHWYDIVLCACHY